MQSEISQNSEETFEKLFPYLLALGILVNANPLFNEILEPDGALYAGISKHIAITGNWTDLFGDGHDWLDKPHFPFWMAALSFKIFGINAFAYKFPAFLFWLAGVLFTYKLTKKLHDTLTAKITVIVYIFSLHNILSNFDVRAEPYLTALSIGAIYYFYKSALSHKLSDVIITALLAAGAVMTKGIFVLLTIGGGFVIYWILLKQWKQFTNYRWWLMLLLILFFITPELYSLYTQFDIHPGKVVFNKTNVSGLRFFFWDSQFGRFFNTGPIKGRGDLSFFLHTALWAFLPWSIMLYIAVIQLFRNRKQNSVGQKWIIYGSAGITFLLFSLSRFQLPHYIVIIFPQFSMITAAYIRSINSEKTIKKVAFLQNALFILAAALVVALSFYSKIGNLALTILLSISTIITYFIFFAGKNINAIIVAGVAFSFVVFSFLNNLFYPNLLKYQSGMMAGRWLTDNKIDNISAMYKSSSYSFEFYAPGIVQRLETLSDLDNFSANNNSIIYTSASNLKELEKWGYNCTVVKSFPDFHISMLTAKFLNPATRSEELQKRVLVRIKSRP